MPNNYFQFKRFLIYQDKCSMKVCTDACIFGSRVAQKIQEDHLNISNCLDIGTGTGLLSLMLAQKTVFTIDAIEIVENALIQARENFHNSPWKDRLNVFHADAKELSPAKKYDLIISNPPFFENDLLSGHHHKNVAKHAAALTLKELITVAVNQITDTGFLAILVPYSRIEYLKKYAQAYNFFLIDVLLIRQTPAHTFFRGVLIFSRNKTELKTQHLTIKKPHGEYTQDFKMLLKDYYLDL